MGAIPPWPCSWRMARHLSQEASWEQSAGDRWLQLRTTQDPWGRTGVRKDVLESPDALQSLLLGGEGSGNQSLGRREGNGQCEGAVAGVATGLRGGFQGAMWLPPCPEDSLRSPTEQGPGDQGAPRSSSAASPSCYSCPLGGQQGPCSQPGASEPALGCLLHLL